MSKKFVGKVLAGLALGGATLLMAPGIAQASDGPGGDWPKGHDDKAQCAEWHGPKGGAPNGEASEGGAPWQAQKEESAKHDGDKKDGPKGGDDCAPRGAVDGGAAGVSTDATLATSGAALVGVAALGGLVLLRRRRTDGAVA
ncbi:hypothetical protein O7635_31045 [Asanoa sp. WMMD1127]|uniref:hypothetical protein n=1 Tax=Asanoa sp. WMMD1127 TaxID=3016107 RepID=UPI002417DBF7|nr:hypothetical protein [Asanoa sp. WMMD1127]MDG4826309.1 hypothetical protein [Asanoa sp. WMMD1127]